MLLAGALLYGAPMVSIGKHIGLHVEADLEIKSLSNITMAVDNDKARGDIVFQFTPGLDFVLFEESPRFEFSLGAKRSFIHFLEETDFNDEPWDLGFQTGYTGDLLGVGVFWSNKEALQNISSEVPIVTAPTNARLENDIVHSSLENLGFQFHVAFSPKTGLRSGITWNDTDYAPDKHGIENFMDLQSMTLPIDLFYEITPKLESSIGYRYRGTQVDKGPKHKDHYLNISLLGHVTAKTDLQMVVGYQNRHFKYPVVVPGHKNTTHSLAANIQLKYMPTEKFHMNAGLFRDFSVGSKEGASIEISSANTGFDVFFSKAVVLGTNIQVRHSKYSTGRKDLGANGGVTLTVQPRRSHWDFRSSYRYDWSEFKASGTTFDYKNHNFTLGTSYRY